jgi:hypothetical protein
MSNHIDLENLVRRIVLDIDLLNHFASHGRRVAALAAIELARRAGQHPALDFLEQHCCGQQYQTGP